MKRIIILFTLFIYSYYSFSQKMDYFEKIDSLKIRLFYDYSGNISPKLNADFYREVTLQKTIPSFSGLVTDYTLKGDTVFKGYYINEWLNGYAKYFKNNKLIEEGNYINNQRSGVWKYYYDNGKIKKIANYKDGFPYFSDFFNNKGKPIISNGTGFYEDHIKINNGKNYNYKLSGHLKNSNLNGTWTLAGVTEEKYDNGSFISGYDVLPYKDKPKIDLERLKGFYCQENIKIIKNYFTCPDCQKDISWALYSLDNNLDTTCYLDFVKRVSKQHVLENTGPGYFLIQFDIDGEGSAKNLVIFTHFNDNIEESIRRLIIDKSWLPHKNLKYKNYRIYFPLLIIDNNIFIPNPEINICDTESNYMNEIIGNMKK